MYSHITWLRRIYYDDGSSTLSAADTAFIDRSCSVSTPCAAGSHTALKMNGLDIRTRCSLL